MRSTKSRSIRRRSGSPAAAGRRVVAVAAAIVMGLAVGGPAEAQVTGKWGGAIDPEALHVLKGMTDFIGGLESFGMHTENTYEDVLETGQKIQFGFSSNIVVERPDRIRAERASGMDTKLYIYDGAKLSIYDPQLDLFSTIDVPDNIDDFLHFSRDWLDLVPPAGDMIFSNAFELLTASVTSGFVVGEAMVGGVNCIHLAFTTPVVDWQIWIADGDKPLPYKYVLTTRDDPAQPQFVTVVSKWNTEPTVDAGTFAFKPPVSAIEIDFIRAGASAR